jgi:hypothetical protein
VLNPFRFIAATSNSQADTNHKWTTMRRIAKLTGSVHQHFVLVDGKQVRARQSNATLSDYAYANVRRSCCHGTLNPSRVLHATGWEQSHMLSELDLVWAQKRKPLFSTVPDMCFTTQA